jgi:hypothetical protein
MALAATNGLKKPLNQLENPIYPDIRRAPPRFVWSRKHWNVDVGETMKSIQGDTQHSLGDAVLVQSRDYNQFVYGVSSHKDVVNLNFRPPLETMEDHMPLTRLPRPAVVPRINPGTDLGLHIAYKDDVTKHLTDKIKSGDMPPTFYCPMSLPDDNSILPDLEYKMPQVSASSGFASQFTKDGESHVDAKLIERFETPIISGQNNIFTADGEMNYDYDLQDSRPQVSASAGFTPITIDGDVNHDYQFDHSRPQVSALSGFESRVKVSGRSEPENVRLRQKRMLAKSTVINPAPVNFDPSNNYELKNRDIRLNNNHISRNVQASRNIGVGSDTLHMFNPPTARERKYRIDQSMSTQGAIPTGLTPQMPQLKSAIPKSNAKYSF